MSRIRYQLQCEDIPILSIDVENDNFFKKEFVEPSQYKLVKQILVENPMPHWEDVAPEKKLAWDW